MAHLAMAFVAGWGAWFAAVPACTQQPVVEPPQAPSGEFATADALLAALEKADAGMETLTANISHDVRFEIQGDRQVRKGKLYFENQTPRKFAVLFEELWIGDVVRKEQQLIVFDGEWLVEKNFKEKMMIKRQVVPPGQKFDPLKIGEGPLPIPLGQKKADVMLRFQAELKPVHDGLAPADEADASEKAEAQAFMRHVEGATQIRLIPRPEFIRDTEFSEVSLWYRRDKDGVLLPVMARTVGKNFNTTVVQLSGVHLQRQGQPRNPNADIPADLVRIDAPPAGWDFEQIPFR